MLSSKSGNHQLKLQTAGVAQVSKLEPLIFLTDINDLIRISPLFTTVMYADVTTLYCKLFNI